MPRTEEAEPRKMSEDALDAGLTASSTGTHPLQIEIDGKSINLAKILGVAAS